VRRGYFVNGLAGAQFALAIAVEQLRAASGGDDALLVMSASDPANVWSLKLLNPDPTDAALRPRDASALLVTRSGMVVLTAERRARWVRVRPGLAADLTTAAVAALLNHVTSRRSRDITIETIDGDRATNSEHVKAFLDAGLRLVSGGLRYYASFARG
jgi:ATP-dependent Lhr-like helicase